MRSTSARTSALAGSLCVIMMSVPFTTWARRGGHEIKEIPPSARESTYGAGDWTRTTKHGGRDRYYMVHVPPGYDRARPSPVILFFHGGGGSGANSKKWLGLDALADRENFIVVYPEGTGFLKRRLLTWNAGSCCGYAKNHQVDDVGFVATMLDELGRVFRVDAKRVYATGISNGALMSWRLACQLSNRIAAIAPVAGTLNFDGCVPSRPVAVIAFHGTGDPYEPYGGGKGKSFPGTRNKNAFRSVKETTAIWTKTIGASPTPTSTHRKGSAVCTVHGGGRGGAELVLWTLEGGGHTWPGVKSEPAQRLLGSINRDISANELMWKFFTQHPMR